MGGGTPDFVERAGKEGFEVREIALPHTLCIRVIAFFKLEKIKEKQDRGYLLGGTAGEVVVGPGELRVGCLQGEGLTGEHVADGGGVEGDIVAVEHGCGTEPRDDLLDREVAGAPDIAGAALKQAGVGVEKLP